MCEMGFEIGMQAVGSLWNDGLYMVFSMWVGT